MVLRVKRVYEPAEKADGVRILVDRIWPRGLSKDEAKLDRWIKEIAPSHSLRRWFGHRADRWEEFRERYAAELEGKQELVEEILSAGESEDVITLLYSAKDPDRNNAVCLRDLLERVSAGRPKRKST